MKNVSRISRVLAPAAAALMVIAPFAAFAETTVTSNTIGAVSQSSVTVNGATTVSSSDSNNASTNVNVSANGTNVVTTNAAANIKAKVGTAVTNGKAKADQEIERRVTNLNQLSARIDQMKNVSAGEKASLSASVTNQVNALATLKTSIDASVDVTALKTDIQSITKDYRVYMLVLPQSRIVAASDRVETIVGDMNTLAPKLQARITAAQTAGKNVSAATSAYADMQAKVSDANVQATASANEVANLAPDQGNTTVEASNTASVKDAAAKLKVATADLKAARADVTTILNTVKGTGSVTASTSASANVQ